MPRSIPEQRSAECAIWQIKSNLMMLIRHPSDHEQISHDSRVIPAALPIAFSCW
jgi:hypothetical protein